MPRIIEAEEVRKESLPPASGGVTNDTLNGFIVESEGTVERALGSLPNNDPVVRGFVRDMAAGRALLKLAETREQYDNANALLRATREGLASYIKLGGPNPPDGNTGEGVNEGAVGNVVDDMWSNRDFDIRQGRIIRSADGGDILEGWPW